MRTVDGRYEVLDVLGAGAMATVWRARDQVLGRMVALKRPHPDVEGSGVHERFHREARIAATVNHPHLVSVYDVGSDEDGPYLVMELVDAPSLVDSTVTADSAATVGRELAGALRALHDAGIVHRDVKPANILAAPTGAKLTDFGIARSEIDTEVLTQAGTTFATPAYAAPEVLSGGEHSTASDVFSLGAVLFELVTGRRFRPAGPGEANAADGHDDGAGGTAVLVHDPAWRVLLDDMLSPDPDARPTAADVGERLRAALSVSSVETEVLLVTHSADDVGHADPGDALVNGDHGPGDGRTDDRIVSQVLPLDRPEDRPEPTPEDRSRRRLALFLGALGVLALGLLVVGIASSGDGSGDGGVVGANTLQDPADSTSPAPAVVAGSDGDDGATADDSGDAAVALDQLAAIRDDARDYLAGIPDGFVDPKERDRILSDFDDGFEAFGAGDRDRALREFEKVARRVERRVDGEIGDEAIIRLNRMLSDLGLLDG